MATADQNVTIINGDVTIIIPPNHDHNAAPSNQDELCEQLKAICRKRAENYAREKVLPAGLTRAITSVGLKVTTDIKRANDTGHFDSSKEIIDLHLPQDETNDILPQQLFDHANQVPTSMSHLSVNSDQDEQLETHGNVVGVLGQAGIGKTTLTRDVVEGVLQGDILPTTEFTFCVSLRDIDCSNRMGVLEFLQASWPTSSRNDDASANVLLTALHKSKNVVIILDGLDELNTADLSRRSCKVPLRSKAMPEDIVKCLLSSDLLPNAKKLVTSRPRQMYELDPVYRPRFLTEVKGLDAASVDNLCLQICGGENYHKVKSYLTKHPDIAALCCVPVNCILIIVCLLAAADVSQLELNTMTEVMAFAMCNYVRTPHVKGIFEIDVLLGKLARLACNGINQGRVVFRPSDFDHVDIRSDMVQAFLHVYLMRKSDLKFRILEGEQRSSFSHKIWQEFFTAIFVMLFATLEEFQRISASFLASNFEVVTKFVFGFWNVHVRSELEEVLPRNFVSEEKLQILKQIAVKCVQSTRPLTACAWAYEAQSDVISNTVADHLPDHLSINGDNTSRSILLPGQISSLAYVLQKVTHPRRLSFHGTSFVSNAFGFLASTLDAVIKPTNQTIPKGVTTATAAASHLHVISEVKLDSCKLTCGDVLILSTTLARRHQPLTKLDVRRNELSEKGILQLTKCLPMLRSLALAGCDVNVIGCKLLGTAIQGLDEPLDELYLLSNSLDETGVAGLSSCVGKVNALKLVNCQLLPGSCQILAANICLFQTPLRHLNLSWNDIQDEGVTMLSGCIDNIAELKLGRCNITPVGCRNLSKKIRSMKTPMRKLSVPRNDIGDEGLIELSKSVANIRELNVVGCNITAKACSKLAKKIASLRHQMEQVNLSKNPIGDRGAQSLGACVPYIRKIKLHNCNITARGRMLLLHEIEKLPEPKATVEGFD